MATRRLTKKQAIIAQSSALPLQYNTVYPLEPFFEGPIRLIPAELVDEILIQAWNLECKHSTERFIFPHTTMLVCKQWKELTLNNPILWSDLSFDTTWVLDRAVIDLRLERTKACPIDVVVPYYKRGHDMDQASTVQKVLESVLPHRMRFWSISMLYHHENMACSHHQLLGCGENAEPSASQVVSNVRELDVSSAGASQPSKLVYTPFLEKFIWRSSCPDFHFHSPLAPSGCGRLTHLRVAGLIRWTFDTFRRFFYTLQQNPRLQALEVGGKVSINRPPLLGGIITLQSLSWLKLHLLPIPVISSIISSFEAPNLQDLVLYSMSSSSNRDIGEFSSLLLGEKFKQVQRVAFHKSAVASALSPSLTQLTISACVKEQLEYLSNHIHSSPPLTPAAIPPSDQPQRSRFPNLHTLTFQHTSPFTVKEFLQLPTTIKVIQIVADRHALVIWQLLKNCPSEMEWLKSHFQVELCASPSTLRDRRNMLDALVDEWGIPCVGISQAWTGEEW